MTFRSKTSLTRGFSSLGMKFRQVTESDWPELLSWHEARKRAVLNPSAFPPLGIIAEADGKPIAASWLYLTDSTSGVVGFTITRPGVPIRLAHEAVHGILDQLVREAKLRGVGLLVFHTSSRGMARIAKRLGFGVGTLPHLACMMALK